MDEEPVEETGLRPPKLDKGGWERVIHLVRWGGIVLQVKDWGGVGSVTASRPETSHVFFLNFVL